MKYSLRAIAYIEHQVAYVASVKPLEQITVDANKKESGELYVMIIGESQNRDYMGLYNGFFDNNPKLEQSLNPDNSIIFPHAYACFTHTVPALAYALSNQLMGKTLSANINDIINSDFIPISAVLKGAKVKSFWLSNQNEEGLYDTDTTMLARTFDVTKFITKSEFQRPKFDGELIPAFKQLLGTIDSQSNNVIVIHTLGTHGTYNDRYPDTYSKYQPTLLTKGEFGLIVPDDSEDISYYLNATYYNDEVLSQLISLARSHPSFMGLLFFSDHADQPPYAHTYTIFHYGMSHIPMFFTFSPTYEQRYSAKIEHLRKNREEFFVNDRIYDFFLDLMDIESTAYRPELSLASSEFKPLTRADAAMPEGKNTMSDPDFQVWRQWPSLKGKMAVMRCNSNNKFGLVSSFGVTQAEVDVAYDEDLGLCLNHEECEEGDMTLSSFLQQHRASLSQLFIDLKKSAEDDGALAELDSLAECYDLKSIAIVESSNLELAEQLHDAGWECSYRIPAEELQNALLQLKDSSIYAISFDSSAYDAVNELIDTHQLPAIKQYVRANDVDLGSDDIAAQLAKYDDAATVLVPLETYFDY